MKYMPGKGLQLCLIMVMLCFQGCDTVTRKQSFEQETTLSAKLAGTWLSIEVTDADLIERSDIWKSVLVINKTGEVKIGIEFYGDLFGDKFGDSVLNQFDESNVSYVTGKIEGNTLTFEDGTAQIEYDNSLIRIIFKDKECVDNKCSMIIFYKKK